MKKPDDGDLPRRKEPRAELDLAEARAIVSFEAPRGEEPHFSSATQSEAQGIVVRGLRVYNTDLEVIETTTDKLELALRAYEKSWLESASWQTPLGLVLGLLPVLLTVTKFREPEQFWKAVFGLLALFFFGWLVVAGIKAWRLRKERSVERLIARIKGDRS